MPTRIPKRLTVGPYTYGVHVGGPKWDKHVADHRAQRGDPTCVLFGRTEFLSGSIGICPDQTTDMKRETLLHEVLHAAFFAAGGLRGATDDDEEAIIRLLSPVLIGVLRDNPALVAYLCRQ